VTAGTIRPDVRETGTIQRIDGGALAPVAGELDLTAGWGHAGREGVTMPGAGKIVHRVYAAGELDAISRGAEELGLSLDDALRCLGKATCDVYLNGVAFWQNVPDAVWEYTIGGYQVIKKWLSYREHDLLGRALTTDEAREVTHMARRIAAIVLLYQALDANYLAVKDATISWADLSQKA
jgi:hypothetical protein